MNGNNQIDASDWTEEDKHWYRCLSTLFDRRRMADGVYQTEDWRRARIDCRPRWRRWMSMLRKDFWRTISGW